VRQRLKRRRCGLSKLVVPTLTADRIGIGPFFASVLKLVGVSKQSYNASEGFDGERFSCS
jgi:hypothetical protein